MANVQVIQRNAHLAGAVRLDYVNGREGKVAKAVLTAISNTWRRIEDVREDKSTAIQWVLWGKQAENAAEYLGKGSHVNVVGRVRNNNYLKDERIVFELSFTAEEIDYLDSRADADARRAKEGDGTPPRTEAEQTSAGAPGGRSRKVADRQAVGACA